MRFLRTLASLLGRMFERLARALLSWSSGPDAGVDWVDWARGRDDGPPEHWLRYLRQRSPWLVRGNRPAPPRHPVRRSAEPPPRSARAPEPPRPAAERSQRAVSPPGPPAEHPEATGPTAHDRSASGAGTGPIPVSSGVRRADPAAGAKVMAPGAGPKRDCTPPAVTERGEGRRVADADAPEVAWVTRGRAAVLDAESPGPSGAHRGAPRLGAADVGVEWPELPMRAPAEQLEFPGGDSGVTGPRTESPIAGMRPVGGSGVPKPIVEGWTETGARASARPGPEFLEEYRWPELPDTRSRGAEWEVPSSRSLEREQLRLTRLRAEQAGSSWSGPPS